MLKFLISDCDYTLVDFNHEGGIAALRNNTKFSALADPLDDYFQNILQGMRLGGDEKFKKLKQSLDELSDKIVAGDHKLDQAVWSRELWAYHYLSNAPDPERVKQAQEAADIYWRGVGESSNVYDNTPLFIERLRKNNFHIVLVTSSDARLVFDKEHNQFVYTPNEAKRLKTQRYDLCGLGDLIDLKQNLYIGDPISKPNQIFWEQTLTDLELEVSSDNHIVVIGDSYETDLKGADWFKSQTILIDRNKKHTGIRELPAADHVAHNLEEALSFIL